MDKIETPLRVRYDGSKWRRTLRMELTSLQDDLAHGHGADALGPKRIRQVREDLAAIEERLARPFSILVAGDFKRGKSTLVNALLRREVVTTDVTPETVVIAEIHNGPSLKVEGHLMGGGVVDLQSGDLRSDRLTAIQDNLGTPLDHLRIEVPSAWLEGLAMVDTPGMGDMLWRFDKRVQAYLPLADSVLYVVSALSPLSETERTFLEMSLRPLELSKVTFVVNMIDQLRNEADVERVVAHVRSAIGTTFPDSEVFAVSALDEFRRCVDEEAHRPERAEELAAAFGRLRNHVDTSCSLDRDLVRTERAVNESIRSIRHFRSNVARARAALATDHSQLEVVALDARDADSALRARMNEGRDRLRAGVEASGKEAEGWMRDFVQRLGAELIPKLKDLDHEQIQKHVPFFLSKVLREAVTACVDAHVQPILGLLDELSGATPDNVLDLDTTDGSLESALARATFPTATWTAIDHLHLINAVLPGIAGVVGTALLGLQDTRSRDRAAAFHSQLAAALPDLEQSAAGAVREVYANMAETVLDRLVQAQDAALEQATGEVEAAMKVQAEGAEQVAAVEEGLAWADARARQCDEALSSLYGEIQVAAGA